MRVLCAISAYALLGAVLAAPSAAAQLGESWRIGNWIIGAHTANDGPDFLQCSGTSRYQSGIELTFSFSRDRQWAVGLFHPQWTLEPRAVYPVTMSIDTVLLGTVQLTALGPTMVGTVLPENAELFRRMRQGQRLWVTAVGQEMNFELRDSAKMLANLVDCADRHRRQTASNPFVAPGKGANNSASAPQPAAVGKRLMPPTPEERAKAQQFLAYLVQAGALPGAAPLSGDQVPREMRDRIAAWKGPSTLGSLHIVQPQEGADLDAIANSLIAAAAADCPGGTFASGSVPDPELAVRRVFTGCDDKNRPIFQRFFITPNGSGVHYVISTYAIDRPEPAQEAEDRLREVIVAFVKQVLGVR